MRRRGACHWIKVRGACERRATERLAARGLRAFSPAPDSGMVCTASGASIPAMRRAFEQRSSPSQVLSCCGVRQCKRDESHMSLIDIIVSEPMTRDGDIMCTDSRGGHAPARINLLFHRWCTYRWSARAARRPVAVRRHERRGPHDSRPAALCGVMLCWTLATVSACQRSRQRSASLS